MKPKIEAIELDKTFYLHTGRGAGGAREDEVMEEATDEAPGEASGPHGAEGGEEEEEEPPHMKWTYLCSLAPLTPPWTLKPAPDFLSPKPEP